MMTSKMDHALSLAARGFFVFPIEAGRKSPPRIDDFPHKASRDADQIRRWWTCPVMGFTQDFNIGVSTSRFGANEALLVVDVDNKGNKHGNQTVAELEATGKLLPATYEVRTPSGGRHLVYITPVAVKQGVDVLGNGCDIRSEGGYVVGVGSVVDAGEYVLIADLPPTAAPPWLVDACGLRDVRPVPQSVYAFINRDRARVRAVNVILAAGTATEGERNHKCFILANKLKDLGVMKSDCATLLWDYWNCQPQMDEAEMDVAIASAYRSTQSTFGSASPEVQFTVVPRTLLRKLLDFCNIK